MKTNALIIFLLIYSFGFSQEPTYTIKNLKINDQLSQYGVVFNRGDKVFYSSYKINSFGSVDRNRLDQLVFTLYEAQATDDGEIISQKEFKSADQFTFNSSTAAFSPDMQYMYVTTNEEKRGDVYKHDDKTRNLRIERGVYVEGKGYNNFKPLNFCNPNYSYGHPAVSPDGKYLYFVSNIPSAKGPTDVFRVEIKGFNEFGDPENLGDEINSPRKEMFPYISSSNVLYFSSDRARGIGGLDFYKCIIGADGKVGLPELLPAPFNSRGDDICLSFDSTGKKGYFTSNRPKGKGEDDIYYFVEQ